MCNYARNPYEEYYWGTELVFQRNMPFQDAFYLGLWLPFCSAKRNHLCNFGRTHHGEHFCEIISNLDHWFRRRCCLKIILI